MATDRACYCFIWLVLTCGTIAVLTAAGTSHWVDKGTEVHIGIFFHNHNNTNHFIKFWQPTKFEAGRLAYIACLGFLVLATLLSFIAPCIKKNVAFAFTMLITAAFGTCLAAMVLFTIYYHDKRGYKFSWSFIIGWVGCGLHGAGLIMLFWAGCIERKSK